MTSSAQRQAAETSAQAQLESARLAAEAAKFRPVGVTTGFGTSQFTMSPEGYLTGAGYTLSPELQAYYNALAQQDAALAAQAQQAGQQQLAFGTGLFGTGANLLGGMYGGQVAALSPYTSYLGGAGSIEELGQQALNLGSNLGGRTAAAGANVGQSLLRGGMSAAGTLQEAQGRSPLGTFLSNAASSPYLQSGLGNWMSGGMGNPLQAQFAQTTLGQSGFGTGLAYGNQDYGLFI